MSKQEQTTSYWNEEVEINFNQTKKPLFWFVSSFFLVLLFYFSIDGGLWSIDDRDYDDRNNLVDRDGYYYSMRGVEYVTYAKSDDDWESKKSDLMPYTYLSSLEVISGDSPNDVSWVMAWMFLFASTAQLFACIAFFCSGYHHLRIQWAYEKFKLLAKFSFMMVFILPLISGIIFFFAFPMAMEADSNFFSNKDENSSCIVLETCFIGSADLIENDVISWRPAIFYFVYTFFIPAIALVNYFGYKSKNLESHYSGTRGSDFGENFMELPNHDDEAHVSFRESVGYGVSTIAYWIGYIFVIGLIGVILSIISVWLISKNTVTSWVLVSVFNFLYIILVFALFLAISYKYLSDIRLRGNQSLVNQFSNKKAK